MNDSRENAVLTASEIAPLILGPQKRFYVLALIYGVAISALTLSVPLSVQVLITTVTNSALTQQVIVLALILFVLLSFSALFAALQAYVMELFEREFFSGTVSEVSLRLVYASFGHLEQINRDDLVNRYFDIMTIQKSLPPLLTGVLATGLQTAVGVAVTSVYHPVFLLLNVSVMLFAYLVYRAFDSGASKTALELSETKYQAARWLESLTHANSFFKSHRTVSYAIDKTNEVKADYVAAHKRHFRFTFLQIVGFLVMFATSSATLLGVGGWLVIQGELTVGQLVAAELILAGIFYGFTRYGYYLELYYDAYAALHKLANFYTTEIEDINKSSQIEDWEPSVIADGVAFSVNGDEFELDWQCAPGRSTLVETRSAPQIKAFTDVIQNFARPQSGEIFLGGHAISDFNAHDLRDRVHVIDSTTFPECTIAAYLSIAAPAASRARMREVLDIVRLRRVDDLDQLLTPYGYPLTESGCIKLKIAFAILAQPKVIIMTPLFDTLSKEARQSITEALRGNNQTTLLCFSHRRDLDAFDDFMFWNFHEQNSFDSIEALDEAVKAADQAEAEL
ncbi:MAG: ABC transporter ATP-binding protein [Pseudomonadota bacterium]